MQFRAIRKFGLARVWLALVDKVAEVAEVAGRFQGVCDRRHTLVPPTQVLLETSLSMNLLATRAITCHLRISIHGTNTILGRR